MLVTKKVICCGTLQNNLSHGWFLVLPMFSRFFLNLYCGSESYYLYVGKALSAPLC